MLHVHGRPTALATALISSAYIISAPLNILLYLIPLWCQATRLPHWVTLHCVFGSGRCC